MIREDPQSSVEDLESSTCDFYRGPTLVRRMLAREVIYKTSRWAMVLFLAQDFNKGKWGDEFVLLSRWARKPGRWIKKKDFHLRPGQAVRVLAVAAGWEATAASLKGIGVDLGKAVVEAERGA